MQSPMPSFINSLRCLSSILKKAEQHCKDRKIDPETLLTTRLFPDMLNLKTNVFIACDTAKGLAARLSQTENPKYEDNESTFEELQTRISKTIKFMESVPKLRLKAPRPEKLFCVLENRKQSLSVLIIFPALLRQTFTSTWQRYMEFCVIMELKLAKETFLVHNNVSNGR